MPIWGKTEYQIIREFYGGRTGKRSGVPYINHIDEGLYLLWKWGATPSTLKAFCLHPIVQADDDFWDNQQLVEQLMRSTRHETGAALAKAIEYRYIANAYTSRMKGKAREGVRTSPIEGVNQMLKADKIQNYKDAQLYVFDKDEEDERRLTSYFEFWMHWFDISPREFHEEVQELQRVFPLNYHADTPEEVIDYLNARASQLHDYQMGTPILVDGGVQVSWLGSSECYMSFYVYASARGKGRYRQWYEDLNSKCAPGDLRILTTSDCNMIGPLSKMRIPYKVVW